MKFVCSWVKRVGLDYKAVQFARTKGESMQDAAATFAEASIEVAEAPAKPLVLVLAESGAATVFEMQLITHQGLTRALVHNWESTHDAEDFPEGWKLLSKGEKG